jgi:hypothetical protein
MKSRHRRMSTSTHAQFRKLASIAYRAATISSVMI